MKNTFKNSLTLFSRKMSYCIKAQKCGEKNEIRSTIKTCHKEE